MSRGLGDVYKRQNEIIKKMEPCYMDAMIQRCQTKNDNLCTEIEMYADCKQYHKDEKIKMKNTKRGGCAQCTASSFTYTTENCLRQPSLKGETAVGRILLSQGNMGFSF